VTDAARATAAFWPPAVIERQKAAAPRECDTLCYERGIEFDPADVPLELAEMAQGTVCSPQHDWRLRPSRESLIDSRLVPGVG